MSFDHAFALILIFLKINFLFKSNAPNLKHGPCDFNEYK